jgi:hypothetical protein
LGKLREGDLAGIRRPELVLELLELLWSQAGKELAAGPAAARAVEGVMGGKASREAGALRRVETAGRVGTVGSRAASERAHPEALAGFHRQGLARILAAGISPEQLRRDLTAPGSVISYGRLSRLKPPVLVFSGRDCPAPLRQDALYLRNSVPSAELAPLEKGGPWSAWISNRYFANKLLAHKRSSERQRERRAKGRSRRQTLAGQPLGWMAFLYMLLAWGLALGLDRLPVQPAYMARVLPPLLGGLLPILWLLAPRRLRLLRFLRFRGFVPRNILPPLVGGALLGAAFRCLLLSQGGLQLPALIPDVLLSLPPGAPGRTAALAAQAAAVLLVFGVAENLLVLRRSAGRILIPALLFVLVPLSYPDMLWQIPAGLGAALLFSRSLSLAPPLALLAGVIGAAEADPLFSAIPFSLEGVSGLVAAAAALAAAVLLALLPGRRRRGFSPGDLYYTVGMPGEEEGFRWRAGRGVVLVVFSLIAAAILVFGSLGA